MCNGFSLYYGELFRFFCLPSLDIRAAHLVNRPFFSEYVQDLIELKSSKLELKLKLLKKFDFILDKIKTSKYHIAI